MCWPSVFVQHGSGSQSSQLQLLQCANIPSVIKFFNSFVLIERYNFILYYFLLFFICQITQQNKNEIKCANYIHYTIKEQRTMNRNAAKIYPMEYCREYNAKIWSACLTIHKYKAEVPDLEMRDLLTNLLEVMDSGKYQWYALHNIISLKHTIVAVRHILDCVNDEQEAERIDEFVEAMNKFYRG
jgi:hypothetical protein